MPIYEYRCKSCGHEFEDLLPVDSPNPPCEECRSETEKLVSWSFGIVKGSPNRLLDCVVGDDANKKWQAIEKRRQLRKSKGKQGCSSSSQKP